MNWLYNLGIHAYGLATKLAAPFHKKARMWVEGRRDWERRLIDAMGSDLDWVWMHCSSLGEFEQGRPLIEAIKSRHPDQKVLLTFFSPSGYEVRKDYPLADHVCYLPLDTPRNSRLMLGLVQPKLLIHVKYDLWLNLIGIANETGIKQIIVSVRLQPDSKFLRSSMATEYQKAFAAMNWIFTQDQQTHNLLHEFIQSDRITVAGDTRFDRVAQLPAKFEPIPDIERWIGGRECIVAGSPWPPDEDILLPAIERLRKPGRCWIIAPHEIHPDRIARYVDGSKGRMATYSQLALASEQSDVLWIDNIGMLSRLYHYASIAYIGGGFGVGIHNTQEAAVYGNPVIFGPNYEKFQEAVDLVRAGGAAAVRTTEELVLAMQHWLDNPSNLSVTRNANKEYMLRNTGATAAILKKLELIGWI